MIVQICSCHPNTVAVFKNTKGKTFEVRVECWAVNAQGAIFGMVRDIENGVGKLSNAEISNQDDGSSFVCYGNTNLQVLHAASIG